MHYSWSSPYIPVLENGNYTFRITSEESSVLVVLPLIGEMIGALLIAFIVDVFGRKKMLISSALLSMIVWFLYGIASSPSLMYIERLMSGIFLALAYLVVPMYLGEIASPRARGFLVTINGISGALGELIMYVLGAFVTLNKSAFISMSIPAILLLIFPWMPESPYSYLMHGKEEKARLCLQALRGQEGVTVEFLRISNAVKEQNRIKRKCFDLFIGKSNRKALAIGLGKSD